MDASKKEAERLHPKGQNHLAAEMASRTWPTPMVDDAKNVTPNPKRFKGSLYAEVHDSVWPTPRATMPIKDGEVVVNKKGRRIAKSGHDYGLNLEESVRMWPTPSANEDAAGTPNGKMQRMLGNHPGIRGTTQKEFNKGALNPDWVEWLMGYAPGYTDPDYTEPMHLADHLGFESEPDIPRVTTRKEHRVNRLKCLGNSIVPQIMHEIGKAILIDKEADGVK
jgi:DNA (cytosine-5)-methyltransferase 1|tara:strand:+ start:568 stop:1233 length:666 start_codon:yes stop_codon:yes gene_type:complete